MENNSASVVKKYSQMSDDELFGELDEKSENECEKILACVESAMLKKVVSRCPNSEARAIAEAILKREGRGFRKSGVVVAICVVVVASVFLISNLFSGQDNDTPIMEMPVPVQTNAPADNNEPLEDGIVGDVLPNNGEVPAPNEGNKTILLEWLLEVANNENRFKPLSEYGISVVDDDPLVFAVMYDDNKINREINGIIVKTSGDGRYSVADKEGNFLDDIDFFFLPQGAEIQEGDFIWVYYITFSGEMGLGKLRDKI